MTLPTAEGEISVAEDLLASTIAASARFQTLVGAASAAAAKERIHFDTFPQPAKDNTHSLAELQLLRPCAIVYMDEESGLAFVHDASGVNHNFNFTSGLLKFSIEDNVPSRYADNPSEAMRYFKNYIGVIVQEMGTYAGVAGYLAIERLTVRAIGRSHEDLIPTYGDYLCARFEVAWGQGQ